MVLSSINRGHVKPFGTITMDYNSVVAGKRVVSNLFEAVCTIFTGWWSLLADIVYQKSKVQLVSIFVMDWVAILSNAALHSVCAVYQIRRTLSIFWCITNTRVYGAWPSFWSSQHILIYMTKQSLRHTQFRQKSRLLLCYLDLSLSMLPQIACQNRFVWWNHMLNGPTLVALPWVLLCIHVIPLVGAICRTQPVSPVSGEIFDPWHLCPSAYTDWFLKYVH